MARAPTAAVLATSLAALLQAALVGAALSACATSPSPGPTAAATAQATLYQRVGGRAAIEAVVHDAVGNIAADKRINARFAQAGNELESNLVDLLCVRSGGPCAYRGRDMSAAHEGMHIRDDEFDALLDDIAKSLARFQVPARERAEVMAILEQMRNATVDH